ncbi:hypothetical protein [Loigolactobacillus coryniformis]
MKFCRHCKRTVLYASMMK